MLSNCIQCLICIHSCPVQSKGIANFLSLIIQGQEDFNPWYCSSCWLCDELCPQDIKLWEIKSKLQLESMPPEPILKSFGHLKEIGLTFPFDSSLNETRMDAGLCSIETLPPEIIELFLCKCTAPISKTNL